MRLASSWWLLGQGFSRRFDPNGFGTFDDAMLLSFAALPLAALLWWVLRRCGTWHGLFAPAFGPDWTLLSVVLLLVIGAPTPNQLWFILLLPARWFATVTPARRGRRHRTVPADTAAMLGSGPSYGWLGASAF